MGFSLLLLSDFGSVAELGSLTAMTMIYCLVADLLVLPAQMLVRSTQSAGAETVVVYSDGEAHAAIGTKQTDGDWQTTRIKTGGSELETEIRRAEDVTPFQF